MTTDTICRAELEAAHADHERAARKLSTIRRSGRSVVLRDMLDAQRTLRKTAHQLDAARALCAQ